jgi:prephenate dehydrogenase
VLVEDRASAPQREIIERVWRAAGAARFRYADADTHDRAMAWSSHLPQLVATALAATIAREGVQADLAGPGLLDTTRLSMSPLALWRSVLWAAPADALRAVAAMESALKELRTALEHRDEPAIRALWEQAGAWRAAVQSQ